MLTSPCANSENAALSRRVARAVCAAVVLGIASFVANGCTSPRTLQRTPTETVLESDRVALPTTAFNGYLFVQARINGAGPFQLLVDTGADVMMVSPRVAEAAKIRPWRGHSIKIAGYVGDSVAQLATIKKVECGGLTLRDLTATIASDESLELAERHFAGRFDGVIALTNFQDVILEMDFANRSVAVARPDAVTTTYPRDRAVSYNGLKPVVTLDVAGHPFECLIDTGASENFSLPSLAGLPLNYAPEKSDGLGTAGLGTATARYSSSQLAGTARLGPMVWINPPVRTGAKGRIGHTALALWRVAFDPREHLIYVLDERPEAKWDRMFPDNPRYKGGFFCTIEGDAFRLIEVDPGFAFQRAGLRAGDLVTSVNATPGAAWLLAKHAGKLLTQTLRAARVLFERDGKTFVTTVRLAPMPGG